ncbi:MurR/RpiR family transcriptional regulator [uncultured Corynebacterium sp.]|uniref:MurR/RpiR family transcriptional regulator n=1 Tax=uncultured Corynebacterium sp. TaxID=159447 RepID=UPI0025F2C07F|nr:MurR/RpiR family transcriptional regulator [uncultured Corynebacterium sp.]
MSTPATPPTSRILEALRIARPRLRPAAAKVANLLLTEPERCTQLTSAQLAEAAGASTATITRLVHDLGCANYTEFRGRLIQDLSAQSATLQAAGIEHGEISQEDDLAEMAAKIAFHEARTIEETVSQLDLEAIDAVAQAISRRRRVVLFGVGASGLVAADLQHKLLRIGIDCHFSFDSHVQLVQAALADAASVAIALTFSGRTTEVVESLELAQRNGASTAVVTYDAGSPGAHAAHFVLRTSAYEIELRAAALASRMAQLAVVDVLFARVAQLLYSDLGSTLSKTRAAIGQHKLHA